VYIGSQALLVVMLAFCTAGCHALLPLDEPGQDAPTGLRDGAIDLPARADTPADRFPDTYPDSVSTDGPTTCTHVPNTTTKAETCLTASPPPGSVSVWPVAAGFDSSGRFPASTACDWIDGTKHPAVGIDAANWFVYGGCGDWKEYRIGVGCQLRVMSYSSGCPKQGGVPELAEVMGVVEEWDGSTWQPLRTISHGTVTKDCTQVFEHPQAPVPLGFFLAPAPARVRVRQTDVPTDGFLICVYVL
jgi:hypothetical protein